MHLTSLPAESLAPIRARFLDALRGREGRIHEAATRAKTTEPVDLLEDVHKIRGVAPMLGLMQLGALAADAEDRLDAWFATHGLQSADTVRMPDDLHYCLKALHASIREALDWP